MCPNELKQMLYRLRSLCFKVLSCQNLGTVHKKCIHSPTSSYRKLLVPGDAKIFLSPRTHKISHTKRKTTLVLLLTPFTTLRHCDVINGFSKAFIFCTNLRMVGKTAGSLIYENEGPVLQLCSTGRIGSQKHKLTCTK